MDPFQWVADTAQPKVLGGLTLLLVATSLWLSSMGQSLITPEAPYGIVSYELAGTADRSDEIIRSWSVSAQAWAMLSLGLDYLYLLVYPAWFSLAAVRIGKRIGPVWQRYALAVSWAVLAAAPLDAVENYALIQQLMQGPSIFYAQLAWWCAVPKFGLVLIAAVFLLLAWSASVVSRLRGA